MGYQIKIFYFNFARLLVLASMIGLAFSLPVHAARHGPSGHAEKSFGPKGGGSAGGDRQIKGPKASSQFSVSGPQGRDVQGEASSTVGFGHATGEVNVTTSGGRSATASGIGSVSGNTATGSGTISTSEGRGLAAEGSMTKTESGVSGSGMVTTQDGKSVTGAVEGDKEGGTIEISTQQGDKEIGYGGQATHPTPLRQRLLNRPAR